MPATPPTGGKKTIFDFPDGNPPRTTNAGGAKTPPAVTPATPPDTTPDTEDPEPSKPKPVDPSAEPAWADVLRMRSAPLPYRIYKYEEFRTDNPNSPRLKQVTEMEDEDLDLLWWTRIKELFDRREGLEKQNDKLNNDLAGVQDPELKKSLLAERDKNNEQIQNITDTLVLEMAYTHKEKPNLFDVAQLARLRAIRGEQDAKYLTWREKVILSIKKTRGKLPWESTR